MPKRRRRRWSLEQKAEIVRQFHASDLTRAEFAREQGIRSSVLGNWLKRKHGAADPAPSVVPVQVKCSKSSGNTASVEVVVRGGRVIRVTEGFDQDLFAQLVTALERC